MSAVISDTSPLQYLFQIGLLDLLPALFGEVLVPMAVAREVDAGLARNVPLPEINATPWLNIRPVSESSLMPANDKLGDGELEVIALGRQLKQSLLLLDDKLARLEAAKFSVDVVGTLGILLYAKERHLLQSVSPALERLEVAGFRLHPRTRQYVLVLANEIES